MLRKDTEIRHPHAAEHVLEDGKWRTRIDDARVSVAMQEQGATVTLLFDPETAWSGEAPLLEVRLTPPASGEFEPWRLMANLPLHTQYARAELADNSDNVAEALRALRKVSSTRRGLSDDFLRLVAKTYESLVAEGERYPVKALAAFHHADKSTASRWISAARARGLLGEEA